MDWNTFLVSFMQGALMNPELMVEAFRFLRTLAEIFAGHPASKDSAASFISAHDANFPVIDSSVANAEQLAKDAQDRANAATLEANALTQKARDLARASQTQVMKSTMNVTVPPTV